jgi:hypothetical protein
MKKKYFVLHLDDNPIIMQMIQPLFENNPDMHQHLT